MAAPHANQATLHKKADHALDFYSMLVNELVQCPLAVIIITDCVHDIFTVDWSVAVILIMVGLFNVDRRLVNYIRKKVKIETLVRFTMFIVFHSLDFLGDLSNYTFLETTEYKESKNQCFHFHRLIYGGHIGFPKMNILK